VLDEAKRYLVGVELNEGETEDFKLWQQVLEEANSAALDRVREA